MGKAQYLQRRGLRLYFRLAIPKDVQRYFDGKHELKRSLRTSRYNEAIPAARVETYRAERLFARLVLLSAALAEFVKEHNASGNWRPKTKEETEGVYRLLVGIVGDRHVSELDYKVLSKFRDSLIRFPSNHTKRPAYRGKTISERREGRARHEGKVHHENGAFRRSAYGDAGGSLSVGMPAG
jgi:hypothetical protein